MNTAKVINAKQFAEERGVSYSYATILFRGLEESGVPYVWREGRKTETFPKGKLLLMSRKAYEDYVAGALEFPKI